MLKMIAMFVVILGFLIWYTQRRKKENIEIQEYIEQLADNKGKTITEIEKKFDDLKQQLEKSCEEEGKKVTIKLKSSSKNEKNLNANSGFFANIYVTVNWLEILISDDVIGEVAFKHTVGHELGHKMNEPLMRIIPTKKSRFKNWTRECRCDFYGMKFVLKYKYASTREQVLMAIEKKININTSNEDAKFRKSCLSHPSWELRKNLLREHLEFDDTVIDKIATAAEFTNKRYKDKIKRKARLA